MKISYNWLNKYLDIPCSPEALPDIMTFLGLEVEKVIPYESIPGRLQGIVVGKVVDCQKHPNADRLSLTKVDIGSGGTLQIICGAPNVASGQKVLVAPSGTKIFPVNKDPWTVKKGKIRGVVSEGMICAEDEAGIGEDHLGIVVLPEDAVEGDPAENYFEMESDTIYDIDLTPNRIDATSHYGVARELSAYFQIVGYEDQKVIMPDVRKYQRDVMEMEIDIEVEDLVGCPRYSGVCLKNIDIKESPKWLQNRLKSIGVRPINNIVDITNFILHELGQPLHAFDLDKIEGSKVIVKNLPEGTNFTTLDEQVRILGADDLMICNGKEEGMCIAGVFGGLESGVHEGTKNIFLESAHFNAKRIRRTSTKHKLRTDAALIFEKGSDPNITVYALKRAALLMREICGAEIASELIDIYPKPIFPKEITLEYEHINQLIGTQLPKGQVHDILKALDIEIAISTGTFLKIRVPTNKPDVTRSADVIEEILRIYGFNNVPIGNQISISLEKSTGSTLYNLKREISTFLISRGFLEMMNLSFTQSKYYQDESESFQNKLIGIHNTSNVHLDVMRPEMLCPLLETVVYNQNRNKEDIAMFEFGRVYTQEKGDIRESELLSLVLAGATEAESWAASTDRKVNFFDLKREVEALLKRFGLSGLNFSDRGNDSRFEFKAVYTTENGSAIAELGKVSEPQLKKFGIRNPVYYAEFRVSQVTEELNKEPLMVREFSKFPGTRRDLALILDESVMYEEIEKLTHEIDHKWLKEMNLFDVYRNDKQLGKNKKSYAVSFEFEDQTKTLSDIEVDAVMDTLINAFETKLNASIRK